MHFQTHAKDGTFHRVALMGSSVPRSYKKHVITLGALILVAAVILPVLFGAPRQIGDQEGGDPWRNIIFDFQTLLTGLLAVGAASWTVMTMERTDKEAERRHRQLVQLNLRADRLRIDRLVFPSLQDLKISERALTAINFNRLDQLIKDDPVDLKETLKTIASDSAAIRKILARSSVKGCQDLFGGFLTHQYDSVVAEAFTLERICGDGVLECLTLIQATGKKNPHGKAKSESALSALLLRLKNRIMSVLFHLGEVCVAIDDLSREYGDH